jgi:hypothetical protein
MLLTQDPLLNRRRLCYERGGNVQPKLPKQYVLMLFKQVVCYLIFANVSEIVRKAECCNHKEANKLSWTKDFPKYADHGKRQEYDVQDNKAW